MDEEKPKKKRKKKAAEGEGGEPKEHKPNWREVYATVEDIKGFLADHIYLRWNLVKHRVEARLPMEDTFCVNSELAQFVSDDWQPMSDRLKNTLFTALQTVKSTRRTDFETVLDSGYVKGFHPFLYYLNRLPPWDGQDYILELSVSVSVSTRTPSTRPCSSSSASRASIRRPGSACCCRLSCTTTSASRSMRAR